MTGKRVIRIVLISINLILILTAIIFTWNYSSYMRSQQMQNGLNSFCANVESMKQISENYLRTEQGYIKNWAKYISYKHMTMDEALDYIRQTNNQQDRYAHIVDVDTMDAYSTIIRKDGTNNITCYSRLVGEFGADSQDVFGANMYAMFSGEDDRINILGKYRVDDTQANVVSVGTKVTLRDDKGVDKEYLLLRIIPIESLRKIWVFPMEYMSAEIGLITSGGAYVVPSKSMKCYSFAEFIRAYNFEDNYNEVDSLKAHLKNIDKDVLRYKDSKGVECYWYYSRFDQMNTTCIVGFIPADVVDSHSTNWIIVAVICGVLFILIILDGGFIMLMNRELRRTAHLAEDASRAKSRFLSTMSHDIRTPMNGIIGMTNIAKDHINDPEYVSECLDKVLLASDHLLTLINDILDVSKIESGNMVLTPNEFAVERLLERLEDIVDVQVKKKNIHFEVEKNIGIPYVKADELRLNQIFINLLSNAVKYTPEGGKVRLSLKTESIGSGKARMTYILTDSGIGMSEDFQKNMYHLFTREIDSKIAKNQGTGLGLAIVKQMVDLMGGEIVCDSVQGRGTTFTVVIDVEQVDRKQYEEKNDIDSRTEVNNFAGMRVLVAEDNDLNWEIVKEMMNVLETQCDRACDGKECLKVLDKSEDGYYDIILMDIQMPVMNGREAARRIRRSDREYLKNIPIYAMTADAFAEDIAACKKAGMNGHIAKPVDIKRICDVLRVIKSNRDKK